MDKAKLGITRFFSGYLKNFHKMLFANLIFAVPLVAFSTLFYYIRVWTGFNSMFLALAPVIFVFPFFAGITVFTRNVVRESDDTAVVKLFFKGLKENFLYFLVHGVLLYLAVFFCYASITLYWKLASSNGLFYFAFGVAVIIAAAMLFIFYNVPVMTVTFDLSLKNIYKNCALMAFGELKNNFFATIGLFLLFIVGATIFLAAPTAMLKLIVIALFCVLIVPSTASYIMNFYVYEDMENIISNGDIKSDEIKRKIEAKKNEMRKEEIEEKLDFSALDLDERKDGEEYLYFNGKMIKRKVLIEMKKEAEGKENEQEKDEEENE